MAQKAEEKPESQPIFEPYLQEIKRLQRENKGLKGQNALLRKKEPPVEIKQVESSAKEPDSSASKPAQAEKPEFIRSYEKFCPDCGGPNPSYKQPNLFCKDCGMPMGTKEDAEKIKVCWNCGGTHAKVKEITA